MEKIIQEFFMYNLIENTFIILMYCAFLKLKSNIKDVIAFIIVFSTVNTIIKIFIPLPIIMQIVGIIIMSLFCTFQYKNLFLNNLKYFFIILFVIMPISEIFVQIVYFYIFHLKICDIDNLFIRFLHFLPVYIIDYIFYFIYKKRSKEWLLGDSEIKWWFGSIKKR